MKKFSIILACDEKWGIWKNNLLPWKIKKDMEFFKDKTIWNWKNVIIMWRKTWESIPNKFKPLNNRINCIISKWNNKSLFWEKYFSSIEDCLKSFSQNKDIEEVFIIWWSQIYKMALDNIYLEKIYFTKIYWEFDCDTFINIDFNNFSQIYSSEIFFENSIKFQFKTFIKKQKL